MLNQNFIEEYKKFKLTTGNETNHDIELFKVKIEKRKSVRLLPKLLCLHFNRLTYDVQGNIIINKKVVKFPSELESKEIFPLEHASEHVTYRLCSFI